MGRDPADVGAASGVAAIGLIYQSHPWYSI
jgi:hypothetical protein